LSAALGACAPLVSPERAATRDAELVRSIVQANLAQIAAGRLAVSQARSRQVRRHGERIIREHTVLQAEASELRSARGVPLPTRPDRDQEAALRTLEELRGAQFDRAYLEHAQKGHEALVALLERAAARATDPALRAYAERALARTGL
jgi:putative membrane protein